MTGSSSKLLQNSRQMVLLQIQGKYKANGTKKKTWGKKKQKLFYTLLSIPAVLTGDLMKSEESFEKQMLGAPASGTWWRCHCEVTVGGPHESYIVLKYLWMLVVWNHGILWLFIQLGISYSQLTNSIIFQRGRSTTNQWCSSFCVILCLTFRNISDHVRLSQRHSNSWHSKTTNNNSPVFTINNPYIPILNIVTGIRVDPRL